MIPLRLELHNFMSYRDTVVVDFDHIHVACLSGDNGAGKSALLDAMTWALWGMSRAKSDRDLVTLGETDMRVEFDFSLGEQDFKVHRARTGASNRLALEFYVRRADVDSWEPISGDNASETQRKIESTIRMDYETFTNSAFLLQGRADAFTQKTPGERKRILAEILGLDEYDELAALAREREREARQRSTLQRERIEELDRLIATEQQHKRDLEEVETQIASLESEVAALDRERQAVAAEIELLKAIGTSRDRALERQKTLLSDRKQVESRLESDRKALAECNEMMNRARQIENGYAALLETRKRRDTLSDLLRRRRPIEEEISNLRNVVEREQRRLEHENQRRQDRLNQLLEQQKSIQKSKSTVVDLRTQLEQVEKEIAECADLEDQRSALEEQIGGLTAENKALHEEMLEIKARMEAMRDGEATCPVCRRPLADGDHEHIRSLWEQDGRKLGDKHRENTRRIKELRERRDTLSAGLKNLQQLRSNRTRLATRIEQLVSEVEQAAKIEQQVQQVQAEMKATEDSLQGSRFAAPERERLAHLQKELDELPYDEREHQQVQTALAELEPFEQERQALDRARERVKGLVETIAEREERLNSIGKELNDIEQELAEHEARLTNAEQVEQRHREIQKALSCLNDKRTDAADRRAVLLANLNQIEKARKERRTVQADIRRLSQDADAYRELTAAFGRNGIQSLIINNIIPEIQDEANALLRRMSTSMLEVRLDTSRMGRTTGQLIDTLDITIYDEYGQRPYEMYSGGEAFRIDFAIRVALSRLLARRAGATIDLLVIDEGFGTQDVQGRQGLIEALQSVQSDFDMILVITHIDEIRDMFPTRIDVVKTADGSRVSVN